MADRRTSRDMVNVKESIAALEAEYNGVLQYPIFEQTLPMLTMRPPLDIYGIAACTRYNGPNTLT